MPNNKINNRDQIMEYLNACVIKRDIIIPQMEVKMKKVHRSSISSDILTNIQLLGECVCEALKRQQNFSWPLINKRTKEFYDIMQLRRFNIPKCWIHRVRYVYKLIIANEEEAQNATIPSEVDLHEILNFCMSKLVIQKKPISETSAFDITLTLDNSQHRTRSFTRASSSLGLQITSNSDVLALLKPIKEYAASSANNECLEYISRLEKHIRNK